MTISDFLLKITGQADRFESLMSKLESAFASSEAKDKEIADLNAKLLEKPEAADAGEIARLTSEVGNLTTRAEKAEADLAAEKEGFTAKLNAETARIIAGNGHAPVETATNPGEQGAKSITSAELKSMTSAEREAHFRAGGKVAE